MSTGSSFSSESVFVTSDVSSSTIQRLAEAGVSFLPFDAQELRTALAQENAHLTVIWSRPGQAIVRALLEGEDLAAIVDQWQSRHQVLLKIFRRARRRLLLVDERSLSESVSEQDSGKLASALGLDDLPSQIGTSDSENPAADLLTKLAIPALGVLRECLDELEACSLIPGSELLDIDTLQAAASGFALLQQDSEAVVELKDLTEVQVEEIGLLREQLALQLKETHRIQQQGAIAAAQAESHAEMSRKDAAAARDELQRSRDELQRLRSDSQKASDQKNAELSMVREQLASQAEQLRQEKERSAAEIAKAEERIAQEGKSTKAAKDELQRLRGTWKAEIADKEAEISLFRDQIRLQLEESSNLRSAYDQERADAAEKQKKADYEAERALSRALADLRNEAQERSQLARELSAAKRRIAELENERNALSTTVQDLYASTSWRVTKPLRQIRTVLAPLPTEPVSSSPDRRD